MDNQTIKDMTKRSSKRFATILFAIVTATVAMQTARAQETEPAATSQLANIKLPAGSARVRSQSVPGEITSALKTLIQTAGPKVRQGRNEVLTWTGNGYKSSRAPQIKANVAGALKSAGWTYQERNPDANTGPYTLATAVRTTPVRKAIVGIWMPSDEALLLAWTEMLPANDEAGSDAGGAVQTPESPGNEAIPPSASPALSGEIFEISGARNYVNVMKNAMPKMPSFPQVTRKAGTVRGYVKDSKGKPLQGAVIGARSTSAGGFYSGASAKTDARGYYEIVVPWGAAHFYCAGYTIDYGEGRAALGLHPVDGEADSFATANGAVENWVLLPYGISDRDKASESPHYSGNYYGGSFSISYSVADSRPIFADDSSLPAGSQIELTLTPDGPLIDGSRGQSFTVRRTVRADLAGLFYVNNIPLGRYRIAAQLLHDGAATPMRFKETGPYGSQPFGLEPKESRGSTTLTFRPGGAKAGEAVAAHGNWGQINITLYR